MTVVLVRRHQRGGKGHLQSPWSRLQAVAEGLVGSDAAAPLPGQTQATVGPSACWAIRCLAAWAATTPDGTDVSIDELAEALGLTECIDSKHAVARQPHGTT